MSNFLLAWIVLIPFISSFIIGVMYLYSIKVARVPNFVFSLFGLSAPLLSFLLGFSFFLQMIGNDEIFLYKAYRWLEIDGYDIDMGFMADKLSIFMVLFITFVGWLIHIYASGYMKDDKGYGKFFFYFNFFLASMLLLVLGHGPIIMFMGWEGVGFSSYLLISYYYEDGENVKAGNKAFIANRVGDFGFIVAMVTMFYYAGSNGFDFLNLKESLLSVPVPVLTFIGFSLFVGAIGKSAQIPLFVWLPDAMAGPTPVSALIHAATMVTAGVYMVARFHFLYDLIPHVGLFIAYVGAISALFAAIIATKQTDIKKILAYSTMSQLGYMFIAVGLGGYSVGIFHVFTHAFFKALLFMGAGAVIVALHHEQNIFKMGGMKKKTPLVYFTMLIATLAISGIPPFAGFFSKDEILLTAFSSGEYLLWIIGVFTAILTAYYMFRLLFVVFYGKNYKEDKKLHFLPKSMTTPLVILAIGSILAGFIGIPELLGGENLIGSWLGNWKNSSLHVTHSTEIILMVINIFAALLGIFIAYKKFYMYDMKEVPIFTGIVWNKFYIDEIYDTLIVHKIKQLSIFISYKIDVHFIDKIVMGLSRGFIRSGHYIAKMQNANTRFYAFTMLIGISVISTYLIMVLR
ncbi:NADH-quinone oxidoreductase subunit L [Sulfurospirillum arcachonense]|uniref:NADH-quinone oxidoreductase subunit L n=1 Tax=Sulfurospirillum arcachonense TaxID=57666 RepID=UPI000468B60B|nr:NADH-quinone oxidoreductase subunit L [Sulfurospirillum arcachonense]